MDRRKFLQLLAVIGPGSIAGAGVGSAVAQVASLRNLELPSNLLAKANPGDVFVFSDGVQVFESVEFEFLIQTLQSEISIFVVSDHEILPEGDQGAIGFNTVRLSKNSTKQAAEKVFLGRVENIKNQEGEVAEQYNTKIAPVSWTDYESFHSGEATNVRRAIYNRLAYDFHADLETSKGTKNTLSWSEDFMLFPEANHSAERVVRVSTILRYKHPKINRFAPRFASRVGDFDFFAAKTRIFGMNSEFKPITLHLREAK